MTALPTGTSTAPGSRAAGVVGVLTLVSALVLLEASTTGGLEAVWSAAGLAALARAGVLVAACGTVGALVLAGLVLRRERTPAPPEAAALLRLASRWAVVWVVALAACLALLVSRPGQAAAVAVAGIHGGADELTAVRDALRATVLAGWAAGLVALLAAGVRRPRQLGVVLIVALLALVPAVFVGHSGHADARVLAVGSMLLHVVGAAVWVGGVLALVCRRPRDPAVLRAFSALALGCFVALGVSGVVNLSTQLSWEELLASGAYKWLVGAKVAGLLVLGACGALHRTVSLRRFDAGHPSAFWTLAAGEVVVMSAVLGLAAVLGQTAR
jgi:putative copper resistance protein D